MRRNIFVLVGLIAVVFVVVALGGLVTASSVDTWYPTLRKPSWTPPPWVFSPVWTVLYIAMAVAAWLVWRRRDERPAGWALGLWSLQLALNAAWTPVFFGWHLIGWALVVVVALWLVLALTTSAFFRVSRPAGWLMVPYLAWVSFATALNAAIWQMNLG